MQPQMAPAAPDSPRGVLLREAAAAMGRKDYALAQKDYRDAAEADDPVAMNGLGWLYEHGLGVAKDGAAALSWYQKAAGAGYAQAMENVGWVYQHGDEYGPGVRQDYAAALKWYRRAAAEGDCTCA